MNRLAGALIAYAVLAALSWMTISDTRVRAVSLAVLALFAMKSILRRNEVLHPEKDAAVEQGKDLAKS